MEKIPLKELQNLIYSIFVEFDRICRKHNIKYSMEGGTLMGAVKFSDFVPWDDDIDVIMTRAEYIKFLKVAPKELNEKFFLQSYNNVPEFPLNYAKLCLNGTEIYDYAYTHIKNMHHGIFMDIFPIDNVKPTNLRMHCSQVGVLTGARKVKLKINCGKNGIKTKVYKLLSLLPMKFLCNSLDFFCRKYNNKSTGYMYEICNPNRKFSPLKSEIYEEFIELPFRDGKFMAIERYDDLLKSRFGENYMSELPVAEARKPSHNSNIRIISGDT